MADAERQRIASLEAELAAVRAEMQDFTYTVSHDLRAPLRHILSYVQLVEEDAAHLLPDEVRGFLTVISDSAQHMGVLMDGLLELSRLGTASVQTESVPLQPLVQSVVDALAQQSPERRIDWQLQADMPTVQADATLLRRALECVLDNAVKFSAQRDVAQIVVSAEHTPGEAEGTVTLRVQDNGAGFNPALQARLFKPFQRLHTTKQFPGIGMGLALTHKMLQRMGGTATVQGAVDAGCTLQLTLPAATRCATSQA